MCFWKRYDEDEMNTSVNVLLYFFGNKFDKKKLVDHPEMQIFMLLKDVSKIVSPENEIDRWLSDKQLQRLTKKQQKLEWKHVLCSKSLIKENANDLFTSRCCFCLIRSIKNQSLHQNRAKWDLFHFSLEFWFTQSDTLVFRCRQLTRVQSKCFYRSKISYLFVLTWFSPDFFYV